MRGVQFFCITLLLMLLFLGAPLFGQPVTEPDKTTSSELLEPDKEAQDAALVNTLNLADIWFNRHDLVHGDSFVQNRGKRAEDEFKRFQETLLDKGIKRPKLYAATLAREGYTFLKENDSISAIDSFNKAIMVDPTLSEAYYGRAKAMLAKSIFNVIPYITDVVKGYFAGFGDFWVKLFRMGNWFFTTVIGISLWLVGLILVLFVKYVSLVIHDIGELIPLDIHKVLIAVIGWVVLLLPLLLGKGVFVLLLFWFILIWVYFNKAERIMTGALVILMLAFPTIINYATSFYTMYANKSAHAVLAAYYGGWDNRVTNYLLQWSEEHPADMEPYFLLGMMYRKQGDFFQAKEQYEKALKLDQSNLKLLTNLGNIHYFLNDYKQAIAYYKKAISYAFEDKEVASAHYNLSKAYLAQFDFRSADSELATARTADRAMVTHAENIFSTNPNRKLVDEYLSPAQVWNYFAAENEASAELQRELWSLFVVGMPLNQVITFTVGLIIAIAVLAFLRSKFGFAHHCLMCGVPTCKRCQRHLPSEKYCSHCMQLFIKRDGVDPEMRNEKMLQVHRYKRRMSIIARILSLVFPGGGHIFNNSSVIGGIITFLWILFLTRLAYGDKIFAYPFRVVNTPNTFFTVVIYVVLALLFLTANIHLSRLSEESQ